jgi:ubiquitin C-terminal hydrolase
MYKYESPDKSRQHKNLQDLTDGIVGIRNNSFYCYLNALMQCMVPIDEMRNHYLTQEYAKYKTITTMRDDFSYSNGLYTFYKNVFKSRQDVIEIRFLKEVVAQRFHPVMQHDC